MKAFNIFGSFRSNDEGFALVLTMILGMVMVALVSGAVLVGTNHQLAERYYDRGSLLDMVASSGLELARARINGDPSLYPDSAYNTLENGVVVKDGNGKVIPGLKRWVYAGPSGVTSGQYGIFGSIVAIVRDDGGGEVVRSTEVYEESFARFVYFTDIEGSIVFNGDDFFGPLHTNDKMKLSGSPSVFHNQVTTALTVTNAGLGTFEMGYDENVSRIEMPTTVEITKLQAQATAGGTNFIGDSNGNVNEASTRIEFVAVDLNGDGDTTDGDEGFFKVYRSANVAWLSGSYDADLRNNLNCGRWYSAPDTFVAAPNHPYAGVSLSNAVNNAASVCYLGGDERVTHGFKANDGIGSWVPWTGTQAPGLAGRLDAGYLFPLARNYNPNFKGVIAVAGKVGLSGVVRGRVTVVATDDIVLLDDLTYATDPGAGTCQDITGLFAGDDIMVSHNLMNAAQRPFGTLNHRSYDDTGDEFFHTVILALDQFGAGEPGSGSDNDEFCEGNMGGRGCLYITGGIIQRQRGAVGGSTTGYWKRYSWDPCALASPPPYFPTTERFTRGRQRFLDPTGFSVSTYFANLSPS